MKAVTAVTVVLLFGITKGSAMEHVDAIKVLPEGCVDTTSIEGIIAGTMKAGMSDEEKVLSLYQWYRRVVFHYRYMGKDRRNVLRAINSYGCNLCGSQAAVFVTILKKAGFKTRVVMADGKKGFGGHTFVEVFYDGKWHAFDTMTGFYVYDRGKPPSIASLEQLAKDPSLVTKAEEEHRAPPDFLVCRHDPDVTVKDIPRLEKEFGMKKDRRWATFTFEGGSLLDFWAKAPKHHRILTYGTYGGHYEPGVLDITLKPNERYVRMWDNRGLYLEGPTYKAFGPHHTCGHVDELDPVNFKYFKPYRKEHYGLTKVCYRYYGNGFLEWKPTQEDVALAGKADGLKVENGMFVPAEGKKKGALQIPVKSPYAVVLVEAQLETAPGTKVQGYILEGNRKHGMKAERHGNVLTLTYREHDRPIYKYTLQVETTGGVRVASLKTWFQLNIFSLPTLQPGRNIVHVTAKNPVTLKDHRLVVTYKWREGKGWKKERTIKKVFGKLPAVFEVEVEGPDMPRMELLETALLPASETEGLEGKSGSAHGNNRSKDKNVPWVYRRP